MTKVLANRLKKVMGRVISNFQNAFVEGGQILDTMLIANEAIDSVLKKKGSGLICTLDIEKAYHHVNWDFLVAILAKMGFGHKWIKWCISSPSFSISINGTPSNFFQSSKGLRQGDPISSYLFVIAMEPLSRLLLKAQEGGFISGFTIGEKGVMERKSLISFLRMILLFFVRPLKSKLPPCVGCLCGSKPCQS